MEFQKFENEEPKKKKNIFGGVLTKTALILGVGGIVFYDSLKKKILGNPVSKVRKGLFYATLAGFVLYKCQGEKVESMYDNTKNIATNVYSDFYNLKKNNNSTIEHLNYVNEILNAEKTSIKNVNDSLKMAIEKYESTQESLENKLNFEKEKEIKLNEEIKKLAFNNIEEKLEINTKKIETNDAWANYKDKKILKCKMCK
ncbi:MAG: hypothetical protein WC758_01040 [Candidatus Woesearchaeota archaeon]|jgi:hypothetical protein